jgi:hypothetical protein
VFTRWRTRVLTASLKGFKDPALGVYYHIIFDLQMIADPNLTANYYIVTDAGTAGDT